MLKFVSVPPIQRSVIAGMPQRCDFRLHDARGSDASCRTNKICPPSARDLGQEVPRLVETADRLLQVDDMDLVPPSVDERLHLRIPATGLMAEVDSGVDEFLNGDDWHYAMSVM